MKTIPIFFLIELAQSMMQVNLDELSTQISHVELLNIREKYCRSMKSFGENSEFCQTAKDESTDWIPPGFLLFILSIIWECFQNHLCRFVTFLDLSGPGMKKNPVIFHPWSGRIRIIFASALN